MDVSYLYSKRSESESSKDTRVQLCKYFKKTHRYFFLS